jgi:hypothetical protein
VTASARRYDTRSSRNGKTGCHRNGRTILKTTCNTSAPQVERQFILDGSDAVQSPGEYSVDTEEGQIDSISVSARLRVSATMRVGAEGATEFRSINAEELKEALLRDNAQDDPALAPSARSFRAAIIAHASTANFPIDNGAQL